MIVSVISGRGGAGKTTIATGLALTLKDREPVHFLDCNVEGPDAHIFLKPAFNHRETVSISIPKLNEEMCTYCGRCGEACTRNAIITFAKHVLLFPELCHSCGSCSFLCPQKAIIEEAREVGIVESGSSEGLEFTHGILTTGEVMALPIIKKVKGHADPERVVIIDVAAGTSRTVVEAVKNSDFCILVTDRTIPGYIAFVRAVKMLKQLDIRCGVILNNGEAVSGKVERYCRKENIPVLLTIPQDSGIARLYSQGTALVDGLPAWKEDFAVLFDRILEIIDERNNRPQR